MNTWTKPMDTVPNLIKALNAEHATVEKELENEVKQAQATLTALKKKRKRNDEDTKQQRREAENKVRSAKSRLSRHGGRDYMKALRELWWQIVHDAIYTSDPSKMNDMMTKYHHLAMKWFRMPWVYVAQEVCEQWRLKKFESRIEIFGTEKVPDGYADIALTRCARINGCEVVGKAIVDEMFKRDRQRRKCIFEHFVTNLCQYTNDMNQFRKARQSRFAISNYAGENPLHVCARRRRRGLAVIIAESYGRWGWDKADNKDMTPECVGIDRLVPPCHEVWSCSKTKRIEQKRQFQKHLLEKNSTSIYLVISPGSVGLESG